MLFLATFVRKKLGKRLDVCWMSYSLLPFFLKNFVEVSTKFIKLLDDNLVGSMSYDF